MIALAAQSSEALRSQFEQFSRSAQGRVGVAILMIETGKSVTLPDENHLAVAVFVSDSKANPAVRDSVIARIALAAWNWGWQ